MRGERGRAYAFAGRKAELAAMEEQARCALADRDNGGGIVLVDGIPGIGKTQLLRQLKIHLNSKIDGAEVVAVELNGGILPYSEKEMFETLVEGVASHDGDDRLGRLAGLTVGGVGVSFHPATQPQSAKSVLAALQESVRRGLWKRRLLLVTVDEVQNSEVQERSFLRLLQSGIPDLPMLSVFAGLPNSMEVLEQLGISRPAQDLHLATLSRDEARAAFHKGLLAVLDENSLSAESIDFLSTDERDALADKTDGFPRHVTTAIRGVMRCLDDQHTHTRSFEAIETAIAEERDAYYQNRIPANVSVKDLAPLAMRLKTGSGVITDHELREFIQNMTLWGGQEDHLSEMRARILRSGLIAPAGGNQYSTGVPSMNDYVLRVAER